LRIRLIGVIIDGDPKDGLPIRDVTLEE